MMIGWGIVYLIVILGWTWGMVFGKSPIGAPRFVQEAAHEVHPFIPYVMLLDLAFHVLSDRGFSQDALQYGVKGIAFAGWYLADRDNDDDRWKRRRRKLGDKVRSMGHRLTVAPEGVGS